jgi:6-phospho-3-hexuloisomerase
MNFKKSSSLILNEIENALSLVNEAAVDHFVEILLSSEKVFVIGVGRVMLSMQAFVKRLNHLGISAYCVGDVNEPAITPCDVLVVASGSGESVVPVAIAKVAREHGAKIVHIGSNPRSSLASLVDLFIRIPTRTKLALPDELKSAQIMSSLFEQSLLLIGDAVALMIIERKKLNIHELWRYHANLE